MAMLVIIDVVMIMDFMYFMMSLLSKR
jgi:hypothetical protein